MKKVGSLLLCPVLDDLRTFPYDSFEYYWFVDVGISLVMKIFKIISYLFMYHLLYKEITKIYEMLLCFFQKFMIEFIKQADLP